MVDSKVEGYKSLSADSELQSGYEYLIKGDYKLCKRLIEKKLPKLKSDLDKLNFNILKIQLLYKTKKFKEAKNLINNVKNDIMTKTNVTSEIINYFKNILIELGEEQIASEIYKHSIKNLNLSKLNENEQIKLMKQLTYNFEFQDLYSKITTFLKNESSDINFLTLMKYEIIYILVFKYEKLSKVIANATFKEMMKNYNTLSQIKGFMDILVKYLISLKDYNNFISIFENKETPLTNAPIDDLLIDIYLLNGEKLKLINHLINSIISNIDKCNFSTYQRLVSIIFEEIKDTKDFKFDVYNDFIINSLESNQLLGKVYSLFDNIHIKYDNFNAYKSAIYSKLLIYHYLIMITNNYKDYKDKIFELLVEILQKTVNKQSIIMEISKYFIYLDETSRKIIIESFYSDDISDPDKLVFYLKIEKMLHERINNLDILIDKIDNLSKIYHKLNENDSKFGKLDKGERLISDEIIILINEYFFEYSKINCEDSDKFSLLSTNLYVLNSIAHENSKFNYDISIFLLRICGFLQLNSRALDLLKYMNLKGPQWETSAYIVFPTFFLSQYKPGLYYLFSNFEKWEKENKRSIRKTMWKMFTGRNFWNSDELFTFYTDNENSYYRNIVKSNDIINNIVETMLINQEDEEDNGISELIENLQNIYINYSNNLKSDKIIRNQDLIITIHKFTNISFFNYNYDLLKRNINYNTRNYRFLIDSIGKNNTIYENYPGYKNNYISQNQLDVYTVFENNNYLSSFILNKLVYLNNNDLLEIYNDIKIETYDDISIYLNKLEKYNKEIFNIYLESLNVIDNLTEEKLDIFKYFKENIIDCLSSQRNDIMNNSYFKYQNKKNYFYKIFLFRHYILTLVNVTVKILDIIYNNKKILKDKAGILKNKITNLFKSPLINLFNENIVLFEGVNPANNNESNNSEYINKLLDDIKDTNREIRELSKSYISYIKKNI